MGNRCACLIENLVPKPRPAPLSPKSSSCPPSNHPYPLQTNTAPPPNQSPSTTSSTATRSSSVVRHREMMMMKRCLRVRGGTARLPNRMSTSLRTPLQSPPLCLSPSTTTATPPCIRPPRWAPSADLIPTLACPCPSPTPYRDDCSSLQILLSTSSTPLPSSLARQTDGPSRDCRGVERRSLATPPSEPGVCTAKSTSHWERGRCARTLLTSTSNVSRPSRATRVCRALCTTVARSRMSAPCVWCDVEGVCSHLWCVCCCLVCVCTPSCTPVTHALRISLPPLINVILTFQFSSNFRHILVLLYYYFCFLK